jgi:hypothetical protein
MTASSPRSLADVESDEEEDGEQGRYAGQWEKEQDED